MSLFEEPKISKEEAHQIAQKYMDKQYHKQELLKSASSSLKIGNGIIGRAGTILLWSGVIAAAGLATDYMGLSLLTGLIASGVVIGFGDAIRDSTDTIAAKSAFSNALCSLGVGSLTALAVTAGASSMLPVAVSTVGFLAFSSSYVYHRLR